MGQKINPNALRLGIIENWKSRWWAKTKKQQRDQIEEDVHLRRIIKVKVAPAGIVRIDIERTADNAYRIYLRVARPGLVIGRGGKGIEDLSKALEVELLKILRKRGTVRPKVFVNLTVEEVKRGDISAQYEAQTIAWDLEKRLPGRRVLKKHLEAIMQNRDVKGAKIKLSGRIDGNEISRRETLAKGKLPLQTLRAHIDYGEATAFNTYGTVGVKVWLYKGEVFEK